jgi:hypothetical protein
MKLSLTPPKIPSYVTVGASVVLGVVAYLNQAGTWTIAQPWHALVTSGVAALAALGIAPAAHGSLGTILHLPYAVAIAFASVAATAAVAVATVSGLDLTVRSLIVAILTALAGMLGGTAAEDVAGPVVPPTPAPKS